jgi:hypothetical protein
MLLRLHKMQLCRNSCAGLRAGFGIIYTNEQIVQKVPPLSTFPLSGLICDPVSAGNT